MKKLGFGEIGATREGEGKSSKLLVSLKDPNEDDDIRSLYRGK